MSTKADYDAYKAALEATRRLRRELHTFADREGLDHQTRRGLRLFSTALEPHETDLKDLLAHLDEFAPAP